MAELNLNVPAMHCNHCVHTIKMELSEIDGVDEVAVNLDNNSVVVHFESPASETKILDLLKEINYPAER